ncbi:DcuS/MalK family sensor histidine kinase [Brevibacillus ginsengisoli]|uniref:DcuS/MalK family sensor histidine kinase n=1 Tax=Brevibacillus ginsengisoli TaxID=363854 RepID=UPI003CF013D3
MRTKPVLSLQTKITLLVCGVVVLALMVTNFSISDKITTIIQEDQAEKASGIARTIAHTSLIIEALNGDRPDSDIQAYANEIKQATKVEFIVVMDMNGIRKSHPDPSKVGKPFIGGDEKTVLMGKESVSVAQGTLGMSLRAFTPVFTPQGKQVGAVAVGISLNKVEEAVAHSRSSIYLGIGLGILVGILGALILARKVRAILFGMEPFEIARLLEERSATLESTREGIVAVDLDSRITLANWEAIRLFRQAGLVDTPIGKYADEFIPNSRLRTVLETGEAELDDEQDLNGITILVNRVPIRVNGEIVGAIATFRDKTEIKLLSEQLTGVRMYADALRAQAHEFMNKLHVILGMTQLGFYDQLPQYISGIAHQHQDEIGYIMKLIKDPVMAGFLLGKMSNARERGAELIVSQETYLPEAQDPEVIHELVTILGNLIDNAIDSVHASKDKRITVLLAYENEHLILEVSDNGPGISSRNQERIYEKGFSTKGTDRGTGLFLVHRSVYHVNGQIQLTSQPDQGTTFRISLPYKRKR